MWRWWSDEAGGGNYWLDMRGLREQDGAGPLKQSVMGRNQDDHRCPRGGIEDRLEQLIPQKALRAEVHDEKSSHRCLLGVSNRREGRRAG